MPADHRGRQALAPAAPPSGRQPRCEPRRPATGRSIPGTSTRREDTMIAEARYETLDYAATLDRLTRLEGREVLVELRVGDVHGPFRLAARGVLVGPPPGQSGLTERRGPGDDVEAFKLDNGGFLVVKEGDFV